MNIPEEAIEKGSITFYKDTDEELINAVNAYNKRMGELRIQKKHAEMITTVFQLVNPLVSLTIAAASAGKVFGSALSAMIFFAFLAVYVYFGIVRKNLFIVSAASAAAFFVSPIFILLTLTDFLLWFMHRTCDKPLSNMKEYPLFNDINVHYERADTPKFGEKQ